MNGWERARDQNGAGDWCFPSAPLSSVNAVKDRKKPTKAALETVVYKQLGNTEIQADLYYPTGSDTPTKTMPIGKFST